jgi:hypothetical protein
MKDICPYEECRKELSTPYSLKRHIDTCHNNVRKFMCGHCDKKFSSQRNLWTHLSKHRVTQLSTLTQKPQLPVPPCSEALEIEIEGQGTDYLVGQVEFPGISAERRLEAKLPLAWLLIAGLSRGKGRGATHSA